MGSNMNIKEMRIRRNRVEDKSEMDAKGRLCKRSMC